MHLGSLAEHCFLRHIEAVQTKATYYHPRPHHRTIVLSQVMLSSDMDPLAKITTVMGLFGNDLTDEKCVQMQCVCH